MRYEALFKENLLLLQATFQERLGVTEYEVHQDGTVQLWELSEMPDTLGSEVVRMLRNVKLALTRLDTGNFGICLGCGKAIPLNRLRVLPYADRCISCTKTSKIKEKK